MIDKCHNPYFLCSIEYVILVCGEGSADGWFLKYMSDARNCFD